MTISYILIFTSLYLIVHGFWNLYTIKVYRRAYSYFKKPKEKFLDYLNREIGTLTIKIAVVLNAHKFYDSKLYVIFRILFGLSQVCFGIAILLGTFYISKTDFGILLGIKL